MRRSMRIVGLLAVVLAVTFAARYVWAFPDAARTTKASCAACHTNPAGGAALTAAGKAYADSSKVPAAGAKGSDYLGANKCKMCHMPQHKAWLTTRHAQAFVNLAKADPETTMAMGAKLKVELKGRSDQADACVVCHVTGFKLAGGYPAADSAKTAAVAFVGCEACHGPGSLHMAAKTPAERKAAINGAVTARMCTNCHRPEFTPKFDFEQMRKQGVHAVPAAVSPKKQ